MQEQLGAPCLQVWAYMKYNNMRQMIDNARVAQGTERGRPKPCVGSSNLSTRTTG